MSDLSGKTIQIPADLWDEWTARALRADAEYWRRKSFGAIPRLLSNLADEIERQHPPRTDEPDEFGAMVEAGTHVEGDQPRERRPLVRSKKSGILQWSDEHGRTYAWHELIDPRPVGGAS